MKKNVRNMQYTADDFRLDPEEVAFLRKLKEEHGRRRQWKWYHWLMLVMVNNITFTAIGASIVTSFYGISMAEGEASFLAHAIITDGLEVTDAAKEQSVLVHSGVGKATLEVRAGISGSAASLVLGEDRWPHVPGRGPGGGGDRFSFSATSVGRFDLAQGNETRMQIKSLSDFAGDVEIALVRRHSPLLCSSILCQLEC